MKLTVAAITLGTLGGKASKGEGATITPAQSEASRRNGKLGGRPRKGQEKHKLTGKTSTSSIPPDEAARAMGAKGGEAKTEAKVKAVKKNIKKAIANRWPETSKKR
jgi:hypothetical protein